MNQPHQSLVPSQAWRSKSTHHQLKTSADAHGERDGDWGPSERVKEELTCFVLERSFKFGTAGSLWSEGWQQQCSLCASLFFPVFSCTVGFVSCRRLFPEDPHPAHPVGLCFGGSASPVCCRSAWHSYLFPHWIHHLAYTSNTPLIAFLRLWTCLPPSKHNFSLLPFQLAPISSLSSHLYAKQTLQTTLPITDLL